MKLTCAECQDTTPHFKGLLDHYAKEHPDLLKRYNISHSPSRSRLLTHSPDVETVLKAYGWNIEDCKIREVKQ